MPPPGFIEVEDISPFTGRIGPIFERSEADGSTTRAFRVLDHHLNGAQITHGGMLMTFADTLLARAIRDNDGGPAVTVRMTTDFLGPSHIKDWIEGRAWVARETTTMFFVEGEIYDGKHMIMRANGIFRKIRRRNG